MPFPYLRHLNLEKCSINDLKTLFQHSNQLRSFSLCLDMHNSSTFDQISFPIQLIRLHLKIENRIISIDEMEYLLLNLPYLQYLQLELFGLQDLFDGDRWQSFTQNLIIFNFKFNAHYNLNRNVLESYRTSYWIEEKHWFVGYNNNSIFSIPHFAPNYIDMCQDLIFDSTGSDLTLPYSRVNTISFGRNEVRPDYYLTHINTLKILSPLSISFLTSFIDLNQIKYLSLSSLYDILTYVPLKETMPQLRELSIHMSVDIDTINRIGNYRFEQIHKLEIRICGQYNEYITEKLIFLFPNVHHLICTPETNPKEVMYRCVNGFKYLLNASFSLRISSNIERDFEFITRQSRCSTKDNFICQVCHPLKRELIFSVHWWFGKQSSSFFTRYCSIQPKYHWHRIRYYWLKFMDKLLPKCFPYILCIVIIYSVSIWIIKISLSDRLAVMEDPYVDQSYQGRDIVDLLICDCAREHVKLIKTEDLDPNRNYIFGYHPHGTATVGAGINFLTEATHFSTLFPSIRPHLMGLHTNFFCPFLRELFLSLGECSVSRESCQYFLNGSSGQGNAVVIVTGGMKELYLTEYQRMIFYLKKRKGFIRLALENGVSLVPVITFGENEHYRHYKNWISNRWIWGRSIVGCLPLRHPVTTVVGKPIHVNQIIDPSQTDIDQLHDQYLQATEQLYNTNKANYGFENVKLEII
ncbi:unnamed protein product [Adineta steineri]|uniref:diacylglycerol O-acyltransferase n=1 Tax=Adineta steineri TaxID=433720 RepID=A0A814M9V1_9BILA|nr:unnamed protein product [Adineta steineri]